MVGTNLQRVARVDEIPETGSLVVTVNGTEIGIFRVGSELVAWRNVCPHFAAPVCKGTVAGTTLPSGVYQYEYGRDGEILQCPWHGWEFDLRTGEHLAVGSRARLRQYSVEIHGDDVYVAAR
ncbi:Rieske (2Fe-2S) protein [Amycolatopsis sacchari]|uniref:Rieske (2Fe-2S) protein n=1 Tax=Amycolatopsis sacchari TaxID=115433 RepID=UPI000B80FF0A|nr:Rieske (2Fe-2S) protein [Amycolatopsis sacchari]